MVVEEKKARWRKRIGGGTRLGRGREEEYRTGAAAVEQQAIAVNEDQKSELSPVQRMRK